VASPRPARAAPAAAARAGRQRDGQPGCPYGQHHHGVVTAAAGALRTGSAYARFLDWSRAPDAVIDAEPYNPIFARLSPAEVMRVPQAADAAVIKSFGVTSP
jgi:hypothetical protein